MEGDSARDTGKLRLEVQGLLVERKLDYMPGKPSDTIVAAEYFNQALTPQTPHMAVSGWACFGQ
jgi:hypothetical protein